MTFAIDDWSKIAGLLHIDSYVENLFKNCSNKTSVDKNGKFLLHYILKYASKRMSLMALDVLRLNINDMNITGVRSIHVACRFSSFEVVFKCIMNGADVNVVSNFRWSTFHFVCSRNEGNYMSESYAIIQLMLEMVKDIELRNSKDRNENTPMHLLCMHNQSVDILNLALNNFDVSARNKLGKGPIDYIYKYGNSDQRDVIEKRGLEFD